MLDFWYCVKIMTINSNILKKTMKKAYISLNEQELEIVLAKIKNILEDSQILKNINTENIEPLIHPIKNVQSLRKDVITNNNNIQELEKIAPQFANGCYLVPNILINKTE